MPSSSTADSGTTFTLLEPADTRSLDPAIPAGEQVWLYRYEHPSTGWRLSVATQAPPASGKLSLGGFRIAPAERVGSPGYDNDREAIGLAVGMEEKVRWSRLVGAGGPLHLRHPGRVVGGKCVLRPSDDSRVGQSRDREMLDFATACLNDIEKRAGIHVVTGQDLGHRTMSDGTTQSLQYLHERFRGSMVADTSRPTGEGNFAVLEGMLAAFGIPLAKATITLIGAGHIGRHILECLAARGSRVNVVELSAATRKAVANERVQVFAPDEKPRVLAMPADAVVVNAQAGSLDAASCATIAGNARMRVVCGSENLAMPDASQADVLRRAGKAYCPTEFGGMMGYLTAVEEYYHHLDGTAFDESSMIAAARALREPAERITRKMIDSGFELDWEKAAHSR